MTDDQKAALEKARRSALALKSHATQAKAAGLPILEKLLREASVNCQAAADFQEAHLLNPADPQHVTTAKALGFLPHEVATAVPWSAGGIKCETCGMSIAECSCTRSNADTLADAIKRRGLI